MKRIKTRIFAILMVVAVATFTVCKATGSNSVVDVSGGGKVPDKAVSWTMDASQRGDDGTALLDLGFGPVVAGLGIGDFTFLIEGAEITADTLTGGVASPKLSVSNVPATGTVKVSVKKEGFDFNPASYDWNIATGNTEAAADDDATLASLSVTYTDKTGNLVGGFTPEDLDYSFSAANGEAEANVTVTAASSKASLVISYGYAGGAGQSVANGGSITLPTTGSKTLSVTVTAENSDTQIYTVVIDAYIAQTAPPPTGNGNADYTLQLLSVIYSGQTENILSDFDAANTNYSFNVEQGYETATVYAAVSSSLSALVITYGTSSTDAPQDTSVVNGGVITLPAAGSKVLKIKVTAQNGNAQTYYVTINAYVAVTKGYSGTIVYTGGSKTILGVVGRDAAFVTQSAGVTGTAWTLTVPNGYTPESFVVTLSDGTYSYRSKALYPAAISTSSSITLTIADPLDIGRQVASAIDLADFATALTVNYSLADNITLPDNWPNGPAGYTGKFYGNGYTIKNLKLLAGTGNIGLFSSLGNGALIEDFTIEAATVGTPSLNSLQFGAVVGAVAANVTIRKINVNGDFIFGDITGANVNIGGLVGMVTGGTLTIDKCVSTLNINVNCTQTGNQNYTQSFGGLVSFARAATINITDSYTTGNITVWNTRDQRNLAGGLVAALANSTNLAITRCYASGEVVVCADGRTTYTSGAGVYTGGLFGGVREGENSSQVAITNSAALNKRVLAIATAQMNSGRIIGEIARINTLSLTNNFALKDMVTGSTDAAYPGTSVVGDADTSEGLGKTAGTGTGELRNAATWTSELGFSADVWDFTPLSSGGWPVLK